jgi:hypothetical protein
MAAIVMAPDIRTNCSLSMAPQKENGSVFDAHSRQIEALIEQTGDPVQKATLITLQMIAQEFSLHRQDFAHHAEEEMERWATVRGAWWAFGVVFILAQAVGGWVALRYISNNDDQDARISRLEMRLQRVEDKSDYWHRKGVE